MTTSKKPQPPLHETLAGPLQSALSGGLADVLVALRRIEETVRDQGPQPQLAQGLAEIDMVVPLTRTLRAGLLDELGWDALDEAAAELKGETWCRASWPVLTVHSRTKAIAIGPAGRIAEHRLRVPKAAGQFHHDPEVYFSDGQFLVCHYINGQQTHYWSNTPDETFVVKPGMWKSFSYGRRDPHGYTFMAPNGRRFMGHKVLKTGTRQLGPQRHMFHDGQDFWWYETDGLRGTLHRINPANGTLGPAEHPDFLDPSLLNPGEEWDFTDSSLAKLPEGVTGSPLGSAGGYVGMRVARDRDTWSVRYERIDGVKGELDGNGITAIWGLLDIPGAERPLVLSGGDRLYDPVYARDPDTGALYWRSDRKNSGWTTQDPSPVAAGTRIMPPSAFWHFLTPRDLAGSRVLRGISDATVRRLLKAAKRSDEALYAAVAELLPEISHPQLARGVAGAFQDAVETLRLRDTLVRRVTRAAITRLKVSAEDLEGALQGLVGTYSASAGMIAQIELTSAFFAGTIDSEAAMERWRDNSTGCDWTELPGRIGGLAIRTASFVTTAAHREALVRLLRFWARSPLLEQGLRRGLLDADRRAALRVSDGAVMPLDISMRSHDWGRSYADATDNIAAFLQRGTMSPPDGCLDIRPVPEGWATRERIHGLLGELKRRGPVVYTPDAADRLAEATGLDRAAAALLMTGLPHIEGPSPNFLAPRVRTALEVKVAEAKAARDTLARALPYAARLPLYDAAMPDDPADLWEHTVMVERLAQAWKEAIDTNA
ncbi:MAG: hypothetical protein HOV68_03810 [Streptomycetaceae bacterium]|nr:hypothetical protein [Streptomycetaceae bacterium]